MRLFPISSYLCFPPGLHSREEASGQGSPEDGGSREEEEGKRPIDCGAAGGKLEKSLGSVLLEGEQGVAGLCHGLHVGSALGGTSLVPQQPGWALFCCVLGHAAEPLPPLPVQPHSVSAESGVRL